MLWQQLPALAAVERLEASLAHRLGAALFEQPKQSAVKQELRRLERLSLPLIHPRLRE